MNLKNTHILISGRAKVTNFEQHVQLLEKIPEDSFPDAGNIMLMLSHIS